MNRFNAILLPIFLISLVSYANSQGTRSVTSIDRRIETMNRQTRDYERDSLGREGKKSKEEAAKRNRQIRLEIEEDLKALQAAYNAMALALQEGTLKAGYAAEAARTVGKHAERLKTNLALPTVEDGTLDKQPAQVPEQERPALKSLGRSVYDFITNPIFEGTTALDVKESSRASRDLEAVIGIAHAIASR